MNIIEIVLISISLAMDAFAVSICKGMTIKKISFKKVNIIGIYFGFFQMIMPILGYFFGMSFAEFVKNILEKSGIDIDLPDMIRPEHFKTKKQLKVIYQGLLREYC